MGVNDRVKEFLKSWPIVEKHLNELLQEAIRDGNTRMVELKGGLQAFESIHADTLQTLEGEVSAASASIEGDVEIQPD